MRLPVCKRTAAGNGAFGRLQGHIFKVRGPVGQLRQTKKGGDRGFCGGPLSLFVHFDEAVTQDAAQLRRLPPLSAAVAAWARPC